MATNKRKEAAALFELIDRSTLKVPKNAGALKIPSWWSSKTNPPAQGASTTAAASTSAAPAARSEARITPAPEEKKPETNVVKEEGQSRLFEPPPVDAMPASSPSIRPPGAKSPAPITAPVKAAAPETYKETEAISEQELPPDVPEMPAPEEKGARRVFAPQTHAQDRKSWSPPRSGSLARLPAWVLIGGIVLVAAVAGIVVAVAKQMGKDKPATQPAATAAVVTPSTANSQQLLPPPMTGQAPAGRGGGAAGGVSVPPSPSAARAGRLHNEEKYPFDGSKYYIIICQTPSKTIAERNAGWLVERGIDVAIESKPNRGSAWYVLIAIQPFDTLLAAEPLKAEIVRIGDSHIKDAWKTAYATKVSRQPTTEPRLP
jgi:hypothetical protein